METEDRQSLASNLSQLQTDIEKATAILGNLLDLYGHETGAPAKLPFSMLINVAFAHMTASATSECPQCRAQYGTGTGGAVDKALLPLGDALIGFAKRVLASIASEASPGWLPECIMRDVIAKNRHYAGDKAACERNFAIGADEAALNYLNSLLIEAGMRITDLSHSTFREFDKKPYARMSVHQAFEFTDIRSSMHKRDDDKLLIKQMHKAQMILGRFVKDQSSDSDAFGRLQMVSVLVH